MKKILAAAGIGAALTVGGLAMAGTASADSGSFLNALNANGWHDSYRGSLLDTGYNVCRTLGQGYSYDSAVINVYNSTNASTGLAEARWFVNLAENHLCR